MQNTTTLELRREMFGENQPVPATAVRPQGILCGIGNTPLIRLVKLFRDESLIVYGKLEGLNPGGSSKDRPALRMITRAMESGLINSSTTVIEPSSGISARYPTSSRSSS